MTERLQADGCRLVNALRLFSSFRLGFSITIAPALVVASGHCFRFAQVWVECGLALVDSPFLHRDHSSAWPGDNNDCRTDPCIKFVYSLRYAGGSRHLKRVRTTPIFVCRIRVWRGFFVFASSEISVFHPVWQIKAAFSQPTLKEGPCFAGCLRAEMLLML